MDNEKLEIKLNEHGVDIAMLKDRAKRTDTLCDKITELTIIVKELVVRMDNAEKINTNQDGKFYKLFTMALSICLGIISFMAGRLWM